MATDLRGLDDTARRIVEQSLPFTMTGAARLRALVEAVRYCEAAAVPGALVECGVWRGGSVLAMISTLLSVGSTDRDVFLYDTFEGMTEPSEEDVSDLEPPALETWTRARDDGAEPWSYLFDSSFNETNVHETVIATAYPKDRIHFVAGRVEDTIPGQVPSQIAILRLDTDWYESTAHELEHLYPLLSPGGVLIIDDYGHWDGARRAVDEYLDRTGAKLLLTPVDYSARVAVKPAAG